MPAKWHPFTELSSGYEKLIGDEEQAVEWLHSRWECGNRYDELRVQQDLFGHWLLARVWGRRGSALGQLRHELCVDQAEANARYAQAAVRRERRGYRLRRPINV